MNLETFERISREALKEVADEKEVREHYRFMKWWPTEDWQTGVAITELCATLVEGSEEQATEAEEAAQDVVGESAYQLNSVKGMPNTKLRIRSGNVFQFTNIASPHSQGSHVVFDSTPL